MPPMPRLRLADSNAVRNARSRAMRSHLYDILMAPLEATAFSRFRTRHLRDLHGFGIEVGIGTGLSLRHYPAGVELVGVEPMAEMAARLIERPPGRPLAGVVRATCELLPFADRSVDFVAGHFVLCSVQDVKAAVREFHRVLKPGGQLKLMEHVRSDHPALARLQDELAPAWAQFAFGCRLNGTVRPVLSTSAFSNVVIDAAWLGLIEAIHATA